MNIEQINQYLQDLKPETPEEQSELDFQFPKFEATTKDTYFFVGGYVVFPVMVNVSYQSWEMVGDSYLPAAINVKLPNNVIIGHIYFSNNEQTMSSVDMSTPKMCAYLVDVNTNIFDMLWLNYSLSKDYLVIEEQFYEEYLSYKKTSILWSGFYHEDDKVVNEPLPQAKTEITCLPNLELPTNFHHDNAQRAIAQPYAFERFLKNYHLLELLFDYKVIQDIADNRHDIKVAGSILHKSYKENEELDRLQYVLANCSDANKLIEKLNNITHFQDLAVSIFFQYGKKGNPFSTQDRFNEILLNPTLFQESSFYVLKNNIPEINNKTGLPKLKHQKEDHKTYILEVTAYWIYRIRSSIAHSKIGEFLLSSNEPAHERFMIEFAEPLLQEVLIQCFTK